MQSSPDPEPEAVPQRHVAPVAHMHPATEPMVISSGEDSSSDDEPEHAPDAPNAGVINVEEEDDDIWATVGEVVDEFAAVQEDHAPQLHQSSMNDLQSGGEDEQEQEPEEKQDEEEDGHRTKSLSVSQPQLEVYIPRDELLEEDRADYVDLTAGVNAVLRVLDEREERGGMMVYTVEFEDYHVEKVRLTCDFSC